ncbi:hypothetical protein TRIUR3_05568 [Triticum urartu]|uniref:Uncharacterized protein n=1 Tax=Triticum urartu TaxID=4572 RepID=M8B096_TRIUA|nr:hypothetical protein TRIUR3_05568 [Triticum urartu]
MSSLAFRCGLEWELGWLGGLFTAAELAAADLLLQLRMHYEAATAASTATTSSSPSRRSASSCCEDLAVVVEEKKGIVEETVPLLLRSLDKRARRRSASSCLKDLTVVGEEELEPPRIAKETAPSPGSAELDRRARKRYRLLSELYATTGPVKAAAPAAKKKRKRHHDDEEFAVSQGMGTQQRLCQEPNSIIRQNKVTSTSAGSISCLPRVALGKDATANSWRMPLCREWLSAKPPQPTASVPLCQEQLSAKIHS